MESSVGRGGSWSAHLSRQLESGTVMSRRRDQHQSGGCVLVHDFAGHPFQVQLARRLARNGDQVVHAYCPSVQTPQGAVGGSDGSFTSRPVDLGRSFSKYSTIRRFVDEIDYGVRLGRLIVELRPRVVISANTPLLAAAMVHLVLAVHADPGGVLAAGRLQRCARNSTCARGPVRSDRCSGRSSCGSSACSPDRVTMSWSSATTSCRSCAEWGVRADRVTVIENWAPLDELEVRSRPNPWSQRHGIGDEVVLLYAGTLGLKHDPSMLLELAAAFRRPSRRSRRRRVRGKGC